MLACWPSCLAPPQLTTAPCPIEGHLSRPQLTTIVKHLLDDTWSHCSPTRPHTSLSAQYCFPLHFGGERTEARRVGRHGQGHQLWRRGEGLKWGRGTSKPLQSCSAHPSGQAACVSLPHPGNASPGKLQVVSLSQPALTRGSRPLGLPWALPIHCQWAFMWPGLAQLLSTPCGLLVTHGLSARSCAWPGNPAPQ